MQTAINAATAADETGARLVLMSTNAVFDGRRSLYKEEDEPHPVNVYGQTKLEAEAAALQGGGLVIRASTLAWTGRSKVPFINYAVNELRAGRRVQAYVDIWDSPVHPSTLAEAMSHLMLADSSGIFHVASERLTRYETTRRVAERFGLRAGLVEEARYQFSGSSVRRPPDTSLEAKKLLRTLGIVTPMRDQIERLVTEAATAVASV